MPASIFFMYVSSTTRNPMRVSRRFTLVVIRRHPVRHSLQSQVKWWLSITSLLQSAVSLVIIVIPKNDVCKFCPSDNASDDNFNRCWQKIKQHVNSSFINPLLSNILVFLVRMCSYTTNEADQRTHCCQNYR